MDNHKLGRAVLDIADYRPGAFDMSLWGNEGIISNCGTVACLAGHTLLQSGYRVVQGVYVRPDGSRAPNPPAEAAKLLGLADGETWAGGGVPGSELTEIWYDQADGPERFRTLVEAAEKAAAERGEL